LLSIILQEAVYAGLLATNPVRQVPAPRIESHQTRFYETRDVQHLWQALQNEPVMWQAIIAAGLLLGIRRGELMGLRWGDIDWDRHIIHIVRTAYRVSRDEQQVKVVKVANQLRSIPMPEPLVAILKAWQTEQGQRMIISAPTRITGGFISMRRPNGSQSSLPGISYRH